MQPGQATRLSAPKPLSLGGSSLMSESHSPVLSVILITPDRYATLRQAIHHLQAQTIASAVEIVIVAPEAARLDLDPRDLTHFGSYQVVEAGRMISTAAARAEGVRQARAP